MRTDAGGRPPSLVVDHALFLECVRLATNERELVRKIENLLAYLESFPLGAHNRDVTERLEVLFDGLVGPAGEALFERFRNARDRYMPPMLRIPL